MVLFLSPYDLHAWSPPTRNYFTGTLLLPADIALALVLAVCLPGVLRAVASPRENPGAAGWAAVTVALLLAFPWHPSGRGVFTLLHLGGCAGLAAIGAAVFARARRETLAAFVGAAGIAESMLALVQISRQRPAGLGRVVEVKDSLYPFPRILAPAGSFPHPYVLAGFALVSMGVAASVALDPETSHPGRWAIVAGICAVPIGIAFSRSAALGVSLAWACLVVVALRSKRSRRPAAALLLTIGLGVGLPALRWSQGWVDRGSTTVAAGGFRAPGLANGRGTLTHQAQTLISEHPLTGVGPGRYVFAVEQHFGLANAPMTTGYLAVHDLPLLAGAEGGVLALAAMAGALLWIVWRSARAGPVALGVCLAFLPYCLFDQFPYESAQGAVICGIWLATVDALILVAGRPVPASDDGGPSQRIEPSR